MRTPRLALAVSPAVVAVLAALALSIAPRAVAGPAGANEFESLSATFKKELGDDKPATRLHAFLLASESKDPRVVDLLVEGVAQEAARREAITKEQGEIELALETILSDIEKANEEVPESSREIEFFNKKMKKFEKKRDVLYGKLRDLASDAGQQAAIVVAGVAGLGKVLDAVAPAEALVALDRIGAQWFSTKSTAAAHIRFLDVVAAVRGAVAWKRLRDAATDDLLDPRVRVVAVGDLVMRGENGTTEVILPLLASSTWPVVAATLDGLRRLHQRVAIEPLIAFLDRGEQIGRLRTDAHAALRSLTGQSHGPYAQPWRNWWEGAKATFQLPVAPADVSTIFQPEKGTYFFGIPTFSYHVLYVLDISGSMLDIAHADDTGARANERKIDRARRELTGSIDMLDEKKSFNMVFFGHRVILYQAGMIDADKSARDRAKRFATELEPAGGTNIHDALETAFRLQNASTDGKTFLPAFDTIFFMTDGTPTAGKLQKPDPILAAVAEWNRTAKVTIHVVGVGDSCDEKFLMSLAAANGGIYVHR